MKYIPPTYFLIRLFFSGVTLNFFFFSRVNTVVMIKIRALFRYGIIRVCVILQSWITFISREFNLHER